MSIDPIQAHVHQTASMMDELYDCILRKAIIDHLTYLDPNDIKPTQCEIELCASQLTCSVCDGRREYADNGMPLVTIEAPRLCFAGTDDPRTRKIQFVLDYKIHVGETL